MTSRQTARGWIAALAVVVGCGQKPDDGATILPGPDGGQDVD
jgi:hypothetical protein